MSARRLGRSLLALVVSAAAAYLAAAAFLVMGAGVFWLWIFGDDPWPESATLALEIAGFAVGIVVFVVAFRLLRRRP